MGGCQSPEGGLLIVPHRQAQMGQLTLGQLIEEIGLVLSPVHAPQQLPAAGIVLPQAGVVAGGNGVRPLGQGPVQQGAELDLPVAVDTGIGGAAVGIGPHEPVHDLPLKQLTQIQHHVGDPHGGSYGTGRLDVVRRAAQAGTVLVVVQAQRHAGDVAAGLLQQQRCGGAVHPAAHGDEYAHIIPPDSGAAGEVDKAIVADFGAKRKTPAAGRGQSRCR